MCFAVEMGCVSAKEPKEDHEEKKSPSKAPQSEPAPSQSASPANEEEEAICRQPIEDFYELGREIGRGGFSIVVEGTSKKSGSRFAVKCIKKSMVEGDDIKLLKREIKIMKRLDHPHILKLYEVFEDEAEFYLVMELYGYSFHFQYYSQISYNFSAGLKGKSCLIKLSSVANIQKRIQHTLFDKLYLLLLIFTKTILPIVI